MQASTANVELLCCLMLPVSQNSAGWLQFRTLQSMMCTVCHLGSSLRLSTQDTSLLVTEGFGEYTNLHVVAIDKMPLVVQFPEKVHVSCSARNGPLLLVYSSTESQRDLRAEHDRQSGDADGADRRSIRDLSRDAAAAVQQAVASGHAPVLRRQQAGLSCHTEGQLSLGQRCSTKQQTDAPSCGAG